MNYSEFMGTAYQTECIVEDLDSKSRHLQYIGGLPLASIGIFWSFFLVVVVPFVSFRFQDVDDYENKIFSQLSSAQA